MTASRKRMVFVGGGHANILSLKNADRFVAEGAAVSLIGPDRYHYYSGMGPGMISRIYRPEQLRFDIQTTVESRGGNFIQGKVASIDANNRTLLLEDGGKVEYDLVSFNIGSQVPQHLIPGAEREAFVVKPIENMERIRNAIIDKMKGGFPRILILGGGPAGVEVTGNICRLVQDHRGRAQIILANSTDRLLPSVAKRAGRLAEESLTRRGTEIIPDFLAASMARGIVHAQSGDEIPYDIAILTIGIVPPPVFVDSGLQTHRDGALLVNDYLRSVNFPEMLGGGDCIAMQGKSLDRVGVHAVAQAPVLFQNLLASITGKPLKAYKPQKRYLLIFNLGDGTGIFVRWPIVWKGRLAFALKNRIDTRFISKFRVA